jgi:glycosyltransferase involved in cell wall biosynthesis
MKKVLFLVNHSCTICNFRMELVKRLLEERYLVIVSSPFGEGIDVLLKLGCQHYDLTIDRHGTNLIADLKLLGTYKKMIKEEMPDVVLTYTVKPNIYGGIAAKSLGVPYIANITGLGSAIEKGGVLTRFLLFLYRYSMSSAKCVFFQNKANRQLFLKHHIGINRDSLIPGSGVNMTNFPLSDYPNQSSEIIFAYIGRVMLDKGIKEYTEAAKLIRAIFPNVRFQVIGFIDDKDPQLTTLFQTGCEFIGFVNDIRPYIEKAAAVVLPSYHEGMANVLLEAAAMGRPGIASKIPGCLETFDEGITGLGCEAGNTQSLADTMLRFIRLPWERKKLMGIEGRKKMERQFDRRIVVNAYISEIENLEKELRT